MQKYLKKGYSLKTGEEFKKKSDCTRASSANLELYADPLMQQYQ